jgi:glucose-6-phosphate isomerase
MSHSSHPALREAATRVPPLAQLFTQDAGRPHLFTFDACGIHADFSRQLIDNDFLIALHQYVSDTRIRELLVAMFVGKKMNATEDRAVMHVALRDSAHTTPEAKVAHLQLNKALALADSIRATSHIDAVVNIGIGGSDLGPAMATRALRRYCDGPIVRYVSNIDAADLDSALEGLNPERTMFVVSSKTFTTLETMHNAERAREWVKTALPDWSTRFVAATANPSAAHAWGIADEHCLEFFEWVGGRFSVSSVIGFPLMCAIGRDQFMQFLAGMEHMDHHVVTSDIPTNLAVMHALVWFVNAVCHQMPTVAVIPYSSDLGRLPAYLQQLVMESNGKSVDIDGEPLATPSSPVVWGEPGTNGQHAFFQMLHQGTQVVPVEFIGTVEPLGTDADAHNLLMANMIAQSEALAVGSANTDAHKEFSGNRPSSVLMLERLDPQHLGALISLYEHSTAIQGWLIGVNSFDQFGVELGKHMATVAAQSIKNGHADASQTMTHPLMEWYLQAQKNVHSR